MTGKRCTDCRHTKGIGYDFWCGEGHTEYEVFGAETNCPYYEYHDWSKSIPSKTVKRFTLLGDTNGGLDTVLETMVKDNGKCLTHKECCDLLNKLHEENEQLKQYKQSVSDVLSSWSQKNLTAKQLQVIIAIMEELNAMGDVE